LASASYTTTKDNQQVLIMGQFTGQAVASGNLFSTLGRSTATPPTQANTTNLSNNTPMTNNINTLTYHMAANHISSANEQTVSICSVVDTIPTSGTTVYYSIWGYSSVANNMNTENTILTILAVN
jgi:hypothetical protein